MMKEYMNNPELMWDSEILENTGTARWIMEMVEGSKPRLYVDSMLAQLFNCSPDEDPEIIYDLWRNGINEETYSLINNSVEAMLNGQVTEVQYQWIHPDGKRSLFRCCGVWDKSFTQGTRFKGTHRNISDVVHIDDKWQSKRKLLKSYYNYYSSRDALAILLVNLEQDKYFTIKSSQTIDSVLPPADEGKFSEYIQRFAATFTEGEQSERILSIQDYEFLDKYFQTSPVYKIHFSTFVYDEEARWYRITAHKQDNNEMVVSIEDRTNKISEGLILNTMATRLVGGFIFNLNRDIISVVKMTPFFDYLNAFKGKLTISKGVELLSPHIDEEFREGWMQFASMENLMSVYLGQRRADFPFKTVYGGEHIWLRASIYALETELCKEPSVAIVFRRFSREELAEVDENEKLLHQKEKLEQDYRFIKGIATQYVSLKIVRVDGSYTIAYKDLAPDYGWDSNEQTNFWDTFRTMMISHCHLDNLEKMLKYGRREYVVSLMKGRRRHTVRFRFRMSDGSYIWMECVFIRFDRNPNDELSEFAYALANVDAEVKKEQEYYYALEQARISQEESRLKTQFVNNISHDIRTPLNAVIGYSQLLMLAGDSLTEKEKAEYANYIETSGELLTMLVDDILSVSDIEHDILKIRLMKSQVNLICSKAVSCCMMRVPNGVNLYFTTEFKDDFYIKTDPMRVQQILINMISNSCKATVEGEIKVSCCKSDKEGFIDFTVTDTGCGVSPEKAEEIFNRFVSMDNNESGAGHGLGLDICINISQRLGGYIWLDQTYKPGARFVLTLPLKQ